jgi:hypothetical protein
VEPDREVSGPQPEDEQTLELGRREFLAGLATIAIVGCGGKTDPPIQGGFAEDGSDWGHRVRDGEGLVEPTRSERVPLVIVGGGIAGLSAAWWLERSGFTDFVLVEAASEVGGNARSGENEVSAYPWAAHYVPVPGPDSTLARTLLEELGVLQDGSWNETALVYSPEVRLFRWGRWANGFEELLAESASERRDFERFYQLVDEARSTGQFTIPSSSGAPTDSPLDAISMSRWMDDHDLNSPSLRWYMDYACRDDYGALASDVSAWAGMHYHASRPEIEQGPLAWPEGNGWVVKRLMERLASHVRTGEPVRSVSARSNGLQVTTRATRYDCDAVIWAAPSFVASYVVEGAPDVPWAYSPWITANITLSRQPVGAGPAMAWDNVLFDSASLGYVVADHQSLRTYPTRSVWTWYLPIVDRAPADARELLLQRSWSEWKELILADLERAHPDIRQCVDRIDVMRLGHAMPRPTPGFLSSPERRHFQNADGPLYYANSDVSGLPLFEEAQDRGVKAAERALVRLGG